VTLKTINPTTEEIITEYDIVSKEKISEAVKKAKTAFGD